MRRIEDILRNMRVGPGVVTSEVHEAANTLEQFRRSLRGIVDHWNEFGTMMVENKTDYGLSERIDEAEKLLSATEL